MELIFKALGDRHRRLLLDRLLERDGQTLGELDAAVPDMTRFGVMKHLGVLQTRQPGHRSPRGPAEAALPQSRTNSARTRALVRQVRPGDDRGGCSAHDGGGNPGCVRVGARHTGCDQEPWGRRTVGSALPDIPQRLEL